MISLINKKNSIRYQSDQNGNLHCSYWGIQLRFYIEQLTECTVVLFNVNNLFSFKYFRYLRLVKLLNNDLNDSRDLANYNFKICNASLITRNLDANKIKLITINALSLK